MGARTHFHMPKETQFKTCIIDVVEDLSVCPVQWPSSFVEQRRYIGVTPGKTHKLLLAYVKDLSKTCSASETTVANWVEEVMEEAGVNISIYGPHSIR